MLASSGCITALQVTTPSPLADGAIAPPFTLVAQDGHPVSLADQTGPVVIVFYRGYW
jgi:peroxiredoxin